MPSTHGMHDTKTYGVWEAMKQRCLNERNPSYKNYGGRGITVFDEWMSFEGFLADMGEQPKGLTLELCDNNAGYSKANCVWATRAQQSDNLRTCRKFEYQGKTQSVGAWAREYGLSHGVLWNRLVQLGWSIERALTQAPRQLNCKGA